MKNESIVLLVGLLLIFIIFNSCNHQEQFVKVKWNERTDPVFPPPYRKAMLEDLLVNHKLIGLKCAQLIDTLGNPDFSEEFSFGYRIEEDYGNDIDPISSKDLMFYFSKDSVITSYEVNELKK